MHGKSGLCEQREAKHTLMEKKKNSMEIQDCSNLKNTHRHIDIMGQIIQKLS